MATATRTVKASTTVKPSTTVKASTSARKATGSNRRRMQACYAVGGVGVTALGLSVIHCTESLSVLTGSHWVLSGMLAITIDAGMIACECADVLTHGTESHKQVKPWALAYIIMAVLLSMVLNAIGSAMHAAPDMKVGAYLIGAMVPVLVFVLGRVAGILYTSK